MSSTPRVLGLIPARRGSKGVPGKNTRPVAGASLVERAHRVASRSGVLSRTILSTDDPEALELAERIGLEVPFVRPSAIAADDTPMVDVVLHALAELERAGDRFDAVLLLQPTSPLRRPEHVRTAVQMLGATPSATAVCSVVPIPLERCPHYVMRIESSGRLRPFMADGDRYTRRQDVPRAYARCGTVFLARVEILREERSFYGQACLPMVLDPLETLNIDTPEDWGEAERRLEPNPPDRDPRLAARGHS